ncbi:hypothetical protein AYO38_03715 [bacterium SCGC AG-212-C10]|nr:hypothetical protein AYO38_03715 [bacterium SCGC AG-212-C10]
MVIADTHPLISIGADVEGLDGRIGEVSRVVVDSDQDRITGVVVKRGSILATERIVALDTLRAGEGTTLMLDIQQDEFDQLEPFDETVYRAPDPDYSGPPGFDYESAGATNYALNSYVALGPSLAFGTGGRTGGYPGSEVIATVTNEMPNIHEGTAIMDIDGEKVGEVSELTVDPESAQPVTLRVKQGFIFKSERELPVEWISELGPERILLSVTKAEVETLPKE